MVSEETPASGSRPAAPVESPVHGEPGAIHVAFVPTVDDQVRANRAITQAIGWTRFTHAAFPVLMLAYSALVGVWLGWGTVFHGFALVFPVALLVWALQVPLGRWTVVRHRRQNPHLLGPCAITLHESGMRVESPNSDWVTMWTGIIRARETRDDYLLFVTRRSAVFLPRRALREADEPRLRELLLRHLAGRVQLKKQTSIA
jgi:hypothetical protein